jgi:hypothetical protein
MRQETSIDLSPFTAAGDGLGGERGKGQAECGREARPRSRAGEYTYSESTIRKSGHESDSFEQASAKSGSIQSNLKVKADKLKSDLEEKSKLVRGFQGQGKGRRTGRGRGRGERQREGGKREREREREREEMDRYIDT